MRTDHAAAVHDPCDGESPAATEDGGGGCGHTDHVPTESDPGSATDGGQCGDMAGDLITGPGNSECYNVWRGGGGVTQIMYEGCWEIIETVSVYL